MKIYYFLYLLSDSDIKFLFRTINGLKSYNDIDELIKNNFYRVWFNYNSDIVTNSTIILEIWLFIKYIWKKYWVKPDEINWIMWDNLVIINETLWLSRDNNLIEIENSWKCLFFLSRYDFYNPFWFLWQKISTINKKFPKLIYPNKNLDNYYRANDKLMFIINIYENRKELIWDFMISLFKVKWTIDIKNVLNLRKSVTWKDNVVLKMAWWTDNGKHIQLIDINEYVSRQDLLEYLKLKYVNNIGEYWSNIYFVDYYYIDSEIRLYLSNDRKSNKYKLFSLKKKNNLTSKVDLYWKSNFSTWNNIKVSWDLLDKKELSKEIFDYAEMIFKKNNLDVSVIEFIITNTKELRFLEINTLWWCLMFKWKDEDNIQARITNWWDKLVSKEIKN